MVMPHVKEDAEILRVHPQKGSTNLHQDCDIMINHIRAINNKRLVKKKKPSFSEWLLKVDFKLLNYGILLENFC